MALADYLNRGYLKLTDKNTIRQLEYIKKVYRPNGLISIQDKKEIRKLHSESPDFADCVMMAIYAINFCSNVIYQNHSEYDKNVESDFNPFE